MKSCVTCPCCGRLVQFDDLETYCALCGVEVCSQCIRKCENCGQEVCRDHYAGRGMCIQCRKVDGAAKGLERLKSDSTVDKIGGALETGVEVVEFLKNRGQLKKESGTRERERERAKRELLARQRKMLEE